MAAPRCGGRGSLAVLLVAAAVWCAAYALELLTTGRATREFWGAFEYVGTTVIPPAWLAFVLEYTGRRKQLTPRLLALLAVEPVIVLAVLTVPATHHLVRSFPPGPVPPIPVVDLGPLYWLHFVYTNALIAAGHRAAGRAAASGLVPVPAADPDPARRGHPARCSATRPPASGWAPPGSYDPTPITVSLSGLLLVWGAFRYRLLDLLPVARTMAFERLGDPIIVLDVYGRVVDRNPAAERVFGDGVAIGSPVQGLVQEQEALLDATAAGAEIRLGEGSDTREFDLVVSPLGDDRGRQAGQMVLLRDITARKRAERQLRWLADYDQLTSLPNRRLLIDRLDQAIARSRRAQGRCALLLVDLDRFKLINDSLGHPMGDQVLARVGSRLRAGRREEDTAARMGGDEFALVLPEVASPSDAALVAHARPRLARRAHAVRLPRADRHRECGGRRLAGRRVDLQQLFSCADAALYRAKAHGRNRAESGVTSRTRPPRSGWNLLLNGRGDGVALIGDRAQQLRGQPERRKGHDDTRMGCSRRPRGAASHSQTGKTTEVGIDCGKGTGNNSRNDIIPRREASRGAI